MADPFERNRAAWDGQTSRWTMPVPPETVAKARRGELSLLLTPTRIVPRAWLGRVEGERILCLASGGGQQAPLLAACGGVVTSLDASPVQLGRDREVAEREGLSLRCEEGDMRELSRFADGSFDLVFHPCSNCFVPDPRPVWREAARVLREGGVMLSGFCLPTVWLVDPEKDGKGVIDVRFKVPFSDEEQLPPDMLARLEANGEPLSFGHTLEAQLAGQLEAGFVITDFYEDSWEPGVSAIGDRIALFAATRAVKTRLQGAGGVLTPGARGLHS